MSNFDQYVFALPKAQGPIRMSLKETWDALKSNQRAVTMPQVRRLVLRPLGIKGNPVEVVIPYSADEKSGYQMILAVANTSTAHVAKFEAQAAQAKQDKANRVLIKGIADLFGSEIVQKLLAK